jgi:hypothetical protein
MFFALAKQPKRTYETKNVNVYCLCFVCVCVCVCVSEFVHASDNMDDVESGSNWRPVLKMGFEILSYPPNQLGIKHLLQHQSENLINRF